VAPGIGILREDIVRRSEVPGTFEFTHFHMQCVQISSGHELQEGGVLCGPEYVLWSAAQNERGITWIPLKTWRK